MVFLFLNDVPSQKPSSSLGFPKLSTFSTSWVLAGVVTFSCTFVPMALLAAWRLLDARRGGHMAGAVAEQEEMALQGLVQMRLGWGSWDEWDHVRSSRF